MNKKLIFEYLVSHFRNKYKLSISDKQVVKYMKLFTYVFDSNDMTAAMNTMVENGDIGKFCEWIENSGLSFVRQNYVTCHPKTYYLHIDVIMQPSRFFELLSEAIEKGVIGK